jgi:Tfp pilus assembly protein PilX
MKRVSVRGQRGITLMVVLVMLVVLTLFGIAGINLSTSNLNVVGNMQARKTNEAVALQGVETVLSTINYFNAPTSAVAFTPPTGYTATFANRVCLFAAPAAGYSAVQPIVPEDTNWEVQVSVTDAISGATTGVTQGVKVRMLAGYCT